MMLDRIAAWFSARGSAATDPETARLLRKATLLVKAFERPAAVERLLASIDRYYGHYGPAVRVLIADDSAEPTPPRFPSRNDVRFFALPFDVGLSAGRNFLLDRLETEYFVLLDDDFVFTRATRIERFVETMEENPDLGIVAGTVLNKGRRRLEACRTIEFSDGVLRKSRTPLGRRGALNLYHFVPNFFIARSAPIRKIRWRDDFKVVEHTAFFLDCHREGLLVAEHPGVCVDHLRMTSERYRPFRTGRSEFFANKLRAEFGILDIIDEA